MPLPSSTTACLRWKGVEIEFRENALYATARKAMDRKIGARGLRTILENVLLDTMYEMPSQNSIGKVVVDESVIYGEKPYLIYESPEYEKVASDE